MIEFKNVSFTYQGEADQNGIEDIDLTISDGEVILLTGPSGCGKTTITRLINGLIPHYHEGNLTGEVLINGKNVSKVPIYETAQCVGTVFQNPRSQFFNVDTTSELAFALENQGVPEEEIMERIEKQVEVFKMESLINRSIFKLSGGEKQKIACASISVASPDIIVLDEPSSNLDSESIQDLQQMISVWKQEGRTIIIAEHRLYFLRELADRMLVMKDGVIISEYSSEQLKRLNASEVYRMGIRPLRLNTISYNLKTGSYNKDKYIISDFCFLYKDKKHGINIPAAEIPQNSVVAIIGHNGAGKSTFARCLCGLEKACKGKIKIQDTVFRNKDRLKNCYMVMQDVNHQLFTESVLDEVLLSMEERKDLSEEEKVKEAEEILSDLDLLQIKELHPMSLSGGQKQRVAIASALASKREIILFDEPTSGLDLEHMIQVAEHLQKLQKMGKTVFVITHDLELILNCCNYVIQFERGEIAKQYQLNESTAHIVKRFFIKSAVS